MLRTPAAPTSPLVSSWPAEWNDAVCDRAAVASFTLIFSTAQWVHRRVESIVFVDENAIRRQVSVDFTLPHLAPEIMVADEIAGQRVCYVPLTLLRKRTLLSFDLTDESGVSLPLLTRRQNNAVGARMLLMAAHAILGRAPATSVAEDLQAVACEPQERAVLALERLERPGAEHDGSASGVLLNGRVDDSGNERRLLLADPRLRALAEELANNYLLLVPVPADPHSRRIIKFGYEERPGAPVESGRLRRLAQAMSWSSVPLLLPAAAMGDSGSTHVEVELPEDLEVETVRALDLRTGTVMQHDPGQVNAQDHAGLQRVALHQAALTRGTWGLIEMRVSVRRSGMLTAALGAVLLGALLMIVGTLRLSQLVAHADAGSALLLAVPGLFAGYVLRPGEHRLVSQFFGGLRMTVLVSAICSLVAAISIVTGWPLSTLKVLWPLLSVVTVLCSLAVGVSYVLPLSRMRARHPRSWITWALNVAARLGQTIVASHQHGPSPVPMNVRQALREGQLDLHGLPIESAEGWRSGAPDVASVLLLAGQMNQLRRR